MFIKNLKLPESQLEKDFFLLDNFLDKVPIIVNQLVEKIQETNSEVFERMEIKFSIPELFKSQFEFLINAKREFKIQQLTTIREIYSKLTENGLTEDSLNLKMNVLNWFWYKVEKLLPDLLNTKNHSLFEKFIYQLKSILISLSNALGINSDLFEEAFDLLLSFLEMIKNKNI